MSMIVVIPAYNEERTVSEVVRLVFQCQMSDVRCQVLIVDDGSKDNTAEIVRKAGAQVLQHPINRGLGAALSTGITAALRLGADIIITLDADGQHDPSELPGMIAPILAGSADVVIGSRFVSTCHPEVTPKDPVQSRAGFFTSLRSIQNDKQGGVPLLRRVANFCGNMVTWLLFGIWVSDSQSGFRAFSRAAAEKLQLRTSTMEVSSEIIKEISRNKLRLQEVPITVRYTEYSLSKGQGFLRGLETLWKLIVLKFFR